MSLTNEELKMVVSTAVKEAVAEQLKATPRCSMENCVLLDKTISPSIHAEHHRRLATLYADFHKGRLAIMTLMFTSLALALWTGLVTTLKTKIGG